MMKKLISTIVICCMAASLLVGCGPSRASAQSVTESAIQSIQTVDMTALQQYWGPDSLTEEMLDLEDESAAEFLKQITKNLTYKVISAEENEEAGTATVSVEFTNIDMAPIMTEFLRIAFSDALSYAFLPEDQQPSEEELSVRYMEKLTELMSKEDLATKTIPVDIPLVLVEDQWKITPDDAVIDAMFGGMLTAADAMSEAFDS